MDTTYTDADIVYADANVVYADASADENSWDNADWTSDYINNYADIAYACVDDGQRDDKEQQDEEQQDEEQQDEEQENEEQNSICIYDVPCSDKKMCGDCCIDNFEREQNEEAWEKFKIEVKYNDTKFDKE